jgi:hypothetical protein
MPLFVKKPIVVEGHQWWRNGDYPRTARPTGKAAWCGTSAARHPW